MDLGTLFNKTFNDTFEIGADDLETPDSLGFSNINIMDLDKFIDYFNLDSQEIEYLIEQSSFGKLVFYIFLHFSGCFSFLDIFQEASNQEEDMIKKFIKEQLTKEKIEELMNVCVDDPVLGNYFPVSSKLTQEKKRSIDRTLFSPIELDSIQAKTNNGFDLVRDLHDLLLIAKYRLQLIGRHESHLNNPPWILKSNATDIDALEHFYKSGHVSKKLEQDEKWIQAQKSLERVDAELEAAESRLQEVKEERQRILGQKGSVPHETAMEFFSLTRKRDDEITPALKLAQEEVEKSSKTGIPITDGIEAKSVIIRLVIGSFLALLLEQICKMALGHINPVVNIITFLVFISPLAIYIGIQQKDRTAAIKSRKLEYSKNVQEYNDWCRKLDDTNNEISIIEEQMQSEGARNTKLESEASKYEVLANKMQNEISKLNDDKAEALNAIDEARFEFLASLGEEFKEAKALAKQRFDHATENIVNVQKDVDSQYKNALKLKSIGEMYTEINSESDLEHLKRVVVKLATNRANTLSEALNAVDTEIQTEEMHEESMKIAIEHNQRIEEQEKAKAKSLEKLEFERNRILKEQAEAQLKLQQEKAARDAEHQRIIAEANEEILRLQRDATIAAESAAAAEEQRLLEQQHAAIDEKTQHDALIASNLSRCGKCKHWTSIYYPGQDSYCDYGGWSCVDSDKCTKYLMK